MSTLLTVLELAAKCGVAAVLVMSGVAKLVGGTHSTDRRLPGLLVLLDERVGRLALGVLELALGAASVLALGSPVVDGAILLLCAGFLGGSLVLGVTRPGVACQCFGAASGSAFGRRHSLLTGVLTAGALIAFVAALGKSGTAAWSTHPLMLVTLAGLVLLAARVRPHLRPAARRPT